MLQFTLNECDDVSVTRDKAFYIALFSKSQCISHMTVQDIINPPFTTNTNASQVCSAFKQHTYMYVCAENG